VIMAQRPNDPNTSRNVEPAAALQSAPQNVDLHDLVAREHSQIHEAAVHEDTAEWARRREELLRDLAEAIAEADARRQHAEREFALLSQQRDRLDSLPVPPAADASIAALRDLRQAVHTAHMELMRCRRTPSLDTAPPSQPPITSMGFVALARIGLALTWPVVVAVVLVAVVLAAAFLSVFAG
jgi:hypothetical protein